mmetsp:Transcript_65071/g.205635  ORF Transcript_65071/g.205635 Transcript_65071/m.205635 type:complete len:595 (-) Transcript_65071:133-1917(-)
MPKSPRFWRVHAGAPLPGAACAALLATLLLPCTGAEAKAPGSPVAWDALLEWDEVNATAGDPLVTSGNPIYVNHHTQEMRQTPPLGCLVKSWSREHEDFIARDPLSGAVAWQAQSVGPDGARHWIRAGEAPLVCERDGEGGEEKKTQPIEIAPKVDMKEWARMVGAKTEKVELSAGGGGQGVGVFAVDTIASGETIIEILLEHCMVVGQDGRSSELEEHHTAWQEHHGQMPADLLRFISDYAYHYEYRLAAWLLWAARYCTSPFWRQYFDLAPSLDDLTVPWVYSEAEWAELQHPSTTSFATDALKVRIEAAGIHYAYFAPEGTLGHLGLSRSPEETAWALGMGKTRSFTGARGEIALVPFGDLLNHGWPRAGRNLTARLEVDVMYGPTVGDDGVRVFAFTASEYIGPGEEVFDTYTRESNEGIMLRYGFVVPGNPRDRITLPLAPGQSPPELLSTRVVSSVINISAPLGEMRDPVIEARLSAAIRSFLKKDEAGGPGGDGGVMSEAWKEKVLANIQSALEIKRLCKELLDSHPTTIEQDAALVAGGRLPIRRKAAVEYRLERKHLIKSGVMAMELISRMLAMATPGTKLPGGE